MKDEYRFNEELRTLDVAAVLACVVLLAVSLYGIFWS